MRQTELARVVIHDGERRRTLRILVRADGVQSWPWPLPWLYQRYLKGWGTPLAKAVKKMGGNRGARLRFIGERDGWVCWYCAIPLREYGAFQADDGKRNATLEEVCPRQIGGPKHVDNQVIACGPCNGAVANLSVADKVRFRERKQTEGSQPGTSLHPGSRPNDGDVSPQMTNDATLQQSEKKATEEFDSLPV